eukprot:2204938-Amphidinium_carterae.1
MGTVVCTARGLHAPRDVRVARLGWTSPVMSSGIANTCKASVSGRESSSRVLSHGTNRTEYDRCCMTVRQAC